MISDSEGQNSILFDSRSFEEYNFSSKEEISILDLIKLARELKLDWLYLGYYIKETKSMSYKSIFSPYQLYKNGVWK